MKHKAVFTLLVYLIFGTAGAATNAEIETCAAIGNAAERLFCFDSLAARLGNPGTRSVTAAPKPTEPVARSARPEVPASAGNREAPGAGQSSADESFGLEVKNAREGSSSIQSRYKGTFNGWSGETIFELENGQVWKQSDSGRLVMKAESPIITINRGWLGAFFLKVEGYNKRIRVKRIK